MYFWLRRSTGSRSTLTRVATRLTFPDQRRPSQVWRVVHNPTHERAPGHAVHNMAFKILKRDYAGRFAYNPSKGIDITDSLTNQKVEIATRAQVAYKELKYPNANGIASYRSSPWQP